MIVIEAWAILNIYNFVIALVLFLFSKKDTSNNEQSKAYERMLILIMFLLISDYLSRFGQTHGTLHVLSKLGNMFVFLFDPLVGYAILEYIDTWIGKKTNKLNVVKIGITSFFVLNFVLVLVSHVFNLEFFYHYVDGVYTRGDYFGIRALLLAFEILVLEFYILFRTYRHRNQNTMIIRYFLIPTIVLGALQVVVHNVAFEYTGIVLYALILYIYIQSKNASVDFLTGLVNRRKFESELENRIALKTAFSGIMIDVDFFKFINDQYGHHEGDNALTIVSEMIHKSFRKSDIISRYGGDEFCIITDITDIYSLEKVINRFRKNMEEFNNSNSLHYKISLSLGYDIYKPEFKDGKSFINHLDEKMYFEKNEHHKTVQ